MPEDKIEYMITVQDRPMAAILPVEDSSPITVTDSVEFWEIMAVPGTKIDAKWLSDKSAVELVQE